MTQILEHVNGKWSHIAADPSVDAERLELPAGAVIYEPLTPASNLYFIDSGQVRTYEASRNESNRLLEILGPGDWFGEAALAGADAHSSRAVAVTETVLWAAPVRRLMDALARQPDAAAELIRQLAWRLQTARQDANRLAFDSCSARLIDALLRFSQTAAATCSEDGDVMLTITHRQLAQAVGAARETVSLALTQLRQQNVLRTGRNRLMFRIDALRHFANHNGASAHVPLAK